ncbi:MAG: desulfoferrodoxin Dfx [Lachnospiraceae bacterium]|jgi:superoxide reductase|nr:desulfoferrodoxin Dfx [Lachnospiraceae bacterium]MCI1398628.1 desulfoferrodoxin Dfx [Lachnospiraceae bacterium]MCI1424788.1 desulfoferrodoxin Dfx [Lachnospiraceae bacterium]MCI1452279.1 desulfoferrodoxin Dfx [Lachnospiraceae bacterium]MDD5848461.1 desulfoferrodoxin family protein [Bacillota bacterium]
MLFYKCEKCGNFVTFLGEKSGCTPMCCGQEMTEVVPNTTDAAQEKHVPDVTVSGSTVTVKVGSVTHPMLPEHYIQFIILETSKGFHKIDLKPGDAPEAVFTLAEGETPVAAYENCNLHGLWKKEI